MNGECSLDIKGDFTISLFFLEMSWRFVAYTYYFSSLVRVSVWDSDITKDKAVEGRIVKAGER